MKIVFLFLLSTLFTLFSCDNEKTPGKRTSEDDQVGVKSVDANPEFSDSQEIGSDESESIDASVDDDSETTTVNSGFETDNSLNEVSNETSEVSTDVGTDTKGSSECGNGIVDDGERCDGNDLSGVTCEIIGLGSGQLKCDLNCEYDASGCSEPAVDAGNSEDSGDNDLCDVGVYDPDNPPQNLILSGTIHAHDPTIIEADGIFYRFQTGGSIEILTSTNLTDWTSIGTVWDDKIPSWTRTTDLWAPDIIYMGGQYHLYYSESSFGSNESCIGHATRASLGAGGWQDKGPVICSEQSDNFNAIDPDVSFDENGTPWMSLGSYWDGIMMIKLNPTGNRVGTGIEHLAQGPELDGGGSFIIRRCGYYYLFMSWGTCCPGITRPVYRLTYNIRVGRSKSIHGPYVARDGTPMLKGGGTLVVQGDGGKTYYAAGHGEWILVDDTAYIIYHAYPGPYNQNELRIAELVWDDEGWPVQVGP